MIEQLILAGAGLALKGVGTYLSYDASKSKSEAEQNISMYEQQLEAQRKQAGLLDYQRKTLQSIRDQQKARALALTNATGQGAGAGSGLQGGYGQISGDSLTTRLGLSQSWQIAENTFGINSLISREKMNISKAQSDAALGQGLTSLGGDLIGASVPFGRFFQSNPNKQQ